MSLHINSSLYGHLVSFEFQSWCNDLRNSRWLPNAKKKKTWWFKKQTKFIKKKSKKTHFLSLLIAGFEVLLLPYIFFHGFLKNSLLHTGSKDLKNQKKTSNFNIFLQYLCGWLSDKFDFCSQSPDNLSVKAYESDIAWNYTFYTLYYIVFIQ
jgi:hypothetical protein